MRLLKWISWGLAGLVAVALLGIAIVVWFVDPNSFKSRIETGVREATGRDFQLPGDIELGFFPWLALRTGEGRFGNPPGFPEQPMLSWRSARVGARLIPLLRGELVVSRVRLEGADLRLIRLADGRANWEGIGAESSAQSGQGARRVSVDGVDLRDGHVILEDAVARRRLEVAALELTTGPVAPELPFTDTRLAGVLHYDGFAPPGVPFELRMPKATFTPQDGALAVERFELRFAQLQASGGVRGRLAETPTLSGSLQTNTFDARALLGAIGIDAPKTTDPAALTRVALKTDWGLEAGAIAARDLELTVDDTHLVGRLDRAAGDDPVSEFTLQADTLDLSRYLPPSDPDSEPFVLPAAQLHALKFRGVLQIERVTLDDVLMKGVTLRLVLDEQGLHAPAADAAAR